MVSLDFDRIRVYADPQKVADELVPELLRAQLVGVDSEWYDHDIDRSPVNNGLAFCWTLTWRRPSDRVLQNAYVHAYGASEGTTQALRPFFMSTAVDKTAHNAPVDWHMAGNHGIFSPNLDYDTMVLDHLRDELRENAHDLKTCAADFLGHHRKTFNQTYGSAKLKKDGTPYATGALVVPKLPEYFEGCETPLTPHQVNTALSIPKAFRERWRTHLDYSVSDTFDGYLLQEKYEKDLRAVPWIRGKSMWDYYLEVDRPLTNLIQRMERAGMGIDLKFLREMREIADAEIGQLEADVVRWVGAPINTNSDQQVAKFLHGVGPQTIERKELLENPTPRRKFRKMTYTFEGRGYPCYSRTPTGQPQVSYDVLKDLYKKLKLENLERRRGNKPEMDLAGFEALMIFNRRSTQRNTYLIGLADASLRGRVHGRINQVGTTSSRWSLRNPNLQNVTTGDKDVYFVRYAFEAAPGRILVVADFSQLEYRLLAHYSQDPVLMRMFAEGWDMHSLTTYNLFPSVKAAADAKFGRLCTEALNWIKDEFENERKQGKCVHYDTLITLDGKLRSLGSLDFAGEDEFAEAAGRIADGVGGTKRLNTTYNHGEADLVTVVSKRGVLVCRPDHKIMTEDHRLVRAGNLTKDDVLVTAEVPRFGPDLSHDHLDFSVWPGVPSAQYLVTPEHAYAAGVFLGDGTASESNVAVCHGAKWKKDFAGFTYDVWQREIVKTFSAVGLSPVAQEDKVYLGSRVVLRYFEGLRLVEGSRRRLRVPDWVLGMGRTAFMSFYAGLADTDGYVSRQGNLQVCTKDPVFAGQLMAALQAAGFEPWLDPSWNKTYSRWYYVVNLPVGESHEFSSLLRHRGKVARLRPAKKTSTRKPNNVKFVTPYGRAACGDLNVGGDHLYQANSYVTHNTLNFEIIYGVGWKKLAEQLTVPGEEAKRMINMWFRGYANVKPWMNSVLAEARQNGFFQLLDGRRRHADMARLNHEEYWIRGEEERTLVNAKVQGSAAAMTKKAMLNVDRDQTIDKKRYAALMQVHDELIFDVDRGYADAFMKQLRPHMEQPFSRGLRVAMPVSIKKAPVWALAK